MKIISTVLSTVLWGTAALVLLFFLTNGTFSCTKTFFSNYYNCTASIVIPSK